MFLVCLLLLRSSSSFLVTVITSFTVNELIVQRLVGVLQFKTLFSLKIIEICEGAHAYEQSRLQPRESGNEIEYMKLVESCEAISKNIAGAPVKIDTQERVAVEALVSTCDLAVIFCVFTFEKLFFMCACGIIVHH